MLRNAVITGTGCCAPGVPISNSDMLEKYSSLSYAGTDLQADFDEMVLRGYKYRHRAKNPEDTTATMCLQAGKQALAEAGIKPEEIDILIVATDTPEVIAPSTCCRVQYEIGACNAGCFDVKNSCASFPVALNIASNYIRTDDDIQYILVIAASNYTPFIDPDDFKWNMVIGDGAGAVVLKGVRDSLYGLQHTTIKGRGEYWKNIGVFAGGTWKGLSAEPCEKKYQYFKVIEKYPENLDIETWPHVIKATLEKSNWLPQDVDKLFFSQMQLLNANAICDIFGWDISISHNIIDKYGYTGCACSAMALNDAHIEKLLTPGDKILMCTSGLGKSYAALSLIWGN